MSHGRDEHEEQEQRRKWDEEKDRDKHGEPYPADPWQPERKES